MKWLRGSLVVLVVIASAVVAWRLVIPRYVCNRDKAIVNSAIRLNRAGDYQGTVDARRLEALCRRCLERYPEDYELHLLLASTQELLGDLDGAEISYRRSLRLNERPETFAYLAVAQLKRGKMEEARQNLYHAALFNLSVVELVSDPLRTELIEAVTARHRRLGTTQESYERWLRRRRNPNRVAPPAP